MNKEFHKFCLKSIIVLIIFLGVDFAFGKVFDNMLSKIGPNGFLGKSYYTLNDVEDDVIVVGSSRAVHNYIPSVMSDSLGMNVYNVAQDGCFFAHNVAVINTIVDRYSPKIILWEVRPNYIYGEKNDFSALYPYYRNQYPEIKFMINGFCDYDEVAKLQSNIYRYNSKVLNLIVRYILAKPGYSDPNFGYVVLPPKKLRVPIPMLTPESKNEKINQDKIEVFIRMVNKLKLKGVKLILMDSPFYCNANDKREREAFTALCDSLKVPFFYNEHLSLFMENSQYFNDVSHLNSLGAELYTPIAIRQIKSVLESQ